MLKLEMCARQFFSLSVQCLCQQKSVAKRLFDSVLAKDHVFLKMKQDRRRLEDKTPREIINMDRKTELKM